MILYGLLATACFTIGLFAAAQEVLFRRAGIDHPLCGPRRAVELLRASSRPARPVMMTDRPVDEGPETPMVPADDADARPDPPRADKPVAPAPVADTPQGTAPMSTAGSGGEASADETSTNAAENIIFDVFAESSWPDGPAPPRPHREAADRTGTPANPPERDLSVGVARRVAPDRPVTGRPPARFPEAVPPVPAVPDVESQVTPDRLVHIEASSDFQVGTHNEEYVKYRVRLPSRQLRIDEDVIRALLDEDVSPLRDVFEVEADLDVGAGSPPGPLFLGRRQEFAYGEDTLVVVKRCRDFQIGDHNTLRTSLTIKVMDFDAAVNALQDSTERTRAVRKLLETPTDQAAVRKIAKDIVASAVPEITAEVTAQLEGRLGEISVRGFDCAVRDAHGFQVGEHNTLNRSIVVDVGRPRIDLVEKSLRAVVEEHVEAVRPQEPSEPDEPAPRRVVEVHVEPVRPPEPSDDDDEPHRRGGVGRPFGRP